MASPSLAATLLVEAEHFSNTGGWQVDSQFVEVMGSSMLIAHGLGTPVTDATTTVSFPEPGDYHLWVRTRNWVPAFSNDAAPGRFKVAVNGIEVSTQFGTTNSEWQWQAGGLVNITNNTANISLHDLTGFDGRCDALAFIKDDSLPPPASVPALAAWRAAILGETANPPATQRFDCVIVGGGMAGCCAALAASRSGVRVALVQDRPVPGGNASQDIRVATRGEKRHSIIEEIDTTDLANRDDGTVNRDLARMVVLESETNLTMYMPWRAYGVGTNTSGRIVHVDARQTHTGARIRLEGTLFIDCTGDGWIGYWAGADYRRGREAASEFGESLAPAVADGKTMGNTLMWKTRDAGAPVSFPAVPWALGVAGNRAETGGDWNWEYGMSLDTIADAEAIRDHLLRAIYGNFWNAKQKAANTNLALAWVPFVAGKRESRRLLGDHILKQSDLVNGAYFEDAIATTDWGIDLHFETSVSYLSNYKKTSIKKTYFPFRCLYSRNVPNLMMAGRCFSTTHVGIGSPRVQNTTAQMGVAVGYAAAICKEHGIEPREIYRDANRTVELQSRIAGLWPDRPQPGSVTLDNTTPAPRVTMVGTWTASASVTGFVGTSYLHDGNTNRGTKRVGYSPVLTTPGAYSIALRWAADANRSTNTPVWVCTTSTVTVVASTATAHLRSGQPDQAFSSNEFVVGRYAASDYTRGLLQFDLSSIPASAIVIGAELQLDIAGLDTNTLEGFVGAEGLRVYRVNQPATLPEATWNQRSAGTPWTLPGGDFDTNHLASIVEPTDPNLTATGDIFAFPVSDGLIAATAGAVNQHTNLTLLVRTPTLESTYPARKLYRFASASLEIKYCAVQLPATYTVNQRQNGGTWVTVGTHPLPPDGFTVVIGNDGASGYVIADAVRFLNANATTNDIDGDGLADHWERYFFLSETAANADQDDDGDGLNNFIECMTGTNPKDRGSRFDMKMQLEAPSGTFMMQWPSATGRTYRIEASEDLVTFTPIQQGIPATPPQNSRSVPVGNGERYYRVILE